MEMNAWIERYGEFLDFAGEYFTEENADMIREALAAAAEKLRGLERYDGSPLLDHSVGTAFIVIREIGLGRNSAIATLLHDAVRMGMIRPEEASERFGKEIVPVLEGLCNISEINPKIADDQADDFRDLIVSYSTDPRVILIKLADRLEVMRHLDMFPPRKREQKSWESLNLYAQIAHKLGLYPVKSELEDISLRWLEPDDYAHIESKLAETAVERERFIERFLEPIRRRLLEAGLRYHIKSRTKSVYSIWRKMKKANIPFEEVFDLFALRIILDCPPEQEKAQCWNVYSIVTDFYTPNPDRMRDWISIPKSNGYESLHTTVVTKDGHWVEIQIRSERMDAVAERGIAAHWRYKGLNQGGQSSEQWLERLRVMMEGSDNQSLAQRFDVKLSSGEIFVFTPKGDIRKLPEGATVLDFAYDIHTDVGASCVGGRVNQRNVQMREVLRNGDIVEIITAKNQRPKADWLHIVATNRARNKIRAYLREERAQAASLGREELERRIRNWKLNLTMDDAVNVLGRYYKCKTGIELYGRIASGKIDVAETKELLLRHLEGELFEPRTRPAPVAPAKPREEDDEGDALVIDDSIRGLEYKLARCCNPIYGDEIFGFTTVSAGITVHRSDCPNAARLQERYPYRIREARWRRTTASGSFLATIRVVADDTTGMVNRITELIAGELKLNIRSVSMGSAKGTLSGTVTLEVSGSGVADMVVYRLQRLRGVQKAYRINNR